MIPRLLRLLLLTALPLLGAGCVHVQIGSGAVATLMLIPIYYEDGRGMRNEPGTTYYDSRWYADPDSHPAVRPAPRKAAQPPKSTP